MAVLDAPAAEEAPFGDRVARALSKEIREAERRIAELDGEIAKLPGLYDGPQGSRYGFHSEPIESPDEPHWVQIDLGASVPIDAVVAMPVHIPNVPEEGEGFGFPKRYRIEVAESSNMEDAQVVADESAADIESPGRYPVFHPVENVRGRHVRFTSLRHRKGEQGYYWALEELLVLSGNLNIARGKTKSHSSTLELFPNWSRHRINDGQSRLGLPESDEASPTDGYLSAAAPVTDAAKWIVIDLGESLPVDQIRCIPVESDLPAVIGGRGYPERMIVELAESREFEKLTWRPPSTRRPLGFPWGAADTYVPNGAKGRYVRIRPLLLFARGSVHTFALAEVQVYSNDANVALGKRVETSDVAVGGGPRWAPEHLVDGYSSKRRLVELPGYVRGISQRGERERERAKLVAWLQTHRQHVSGKVAVWGAVAGAVALLGWLWMIFRVRAVRRGDAVRIREQISRDLHDDIGSNLGGIVLLSELAARHDELPRDVADELREIRETAERTSDAMRDIVWLIDVKSSDLRELLIKMRDCADRVLGHLRVAWKVEPPGFRNRELSLTFRRHVFFALKETLTNVRKHAAASGVSVRFEIGAKHLVFAVRDDGRGFDIGEVEGSGQGLGNLRKRAARLKGECRIQSVQGEGSTVTFEAPFKAA